MVITEKKIVSRQMTAKANQSQAHQQRVMSDKPEVDIATVLANELRSSMRRYDELASGSPSDVLFDREFNGYRIILMRGPCTLEPTTTLSPREQEIARMVAKGYPNKTIAAVLEISTWTVDTHLRRMFAKLGVNSRAAMVAQLTHLHDGE
jgi:DNA-binding CsgD family transcriptional regulator